MTPRKYRSLLFATLTALTTPLVGRLEAGTITYVGADTTTNGHWRTTSVVKPLDSDGDNVYGTAGYALYGGGTASSPATFATVTPGATVGTYPGNSNYAKFDSPSSPSTQVGSGVIYTGSADGHEDDFVRVTLTQATSFRLGVITDNADFGDISPDNLRVRQTVGGSANTGLIASPNRPDPQQGSYYFFDITGVVGDAFVVSGTNIHNSRYGGSNGIYGVTFDLPGVAAPVATPEPSTLISAGLAMLCGLAARRRLSRRLA